MDESPSGFFLFSSATPISLLCPLNLLYRVSMKVDQVNQGVRIASPVANLYDRFSASVKTYADRPALKADGAKGETYTYAEANRLIAMGGVILSAIDEPLIGLVGENKPEWPMAYLAILAAGKTVVPIDPNLKPAEITKIIDHSGLTTVIASEKSLSSLSGTSTPLTILHLDSDSPKYWLNQPVNTVEKKPALVNETAVIIYTSGTTGDPKAVELTHRNLIANLTGIEDALHFGPSDVFLSILPLHHTFEASCGFLTPLMNGCCIVYARSLKSRDILDDILANAVTIMCGVPLVYEKMYHAIRREIAKASIFKRTLFWSLFGLSRASRLLNIKAGVSLFRGFREKAGLASIRMFVSGGAPLPRTVSRFFNLVGFDFMQGYGLTECSPVVSVNRPDDNRFGSVGPPLCNVEVRINSPNADGIGEICVRAESTTPGYRGNPERTAELLRDGWLYTGDLGHISHGHLWITGRAKNVIISSAGKNIYPEELEDHLLQSPYIMETVVVGRRQPNGGETVWAVVVPDLERCQLDHRIDPVKPDIEQVRTVLAREVAHVNAHMAEYKRISGFDISLVELEKTSTKKINRQLYTSGSPSSNPPT